MSQKNQKSKPPAVKNLGQPSRFAKYVGAGVAGVVLLIGVAVVISARDEQPNEVEPKSAVELVVSGSIPPMPEDGPDPAIGLPAPKLSGANYDGDPVLVEPGRPRVVIFAAHWCSACNKEIPAIVEHMEESPLPTGVDVVLVSTSARPGAPGYPASKWLVNDMKWPYMANVVVDSGDQKAAAAYGLKAFPYFVAVNSDGEVTGRDLGVLPMWRFDNLVASAAGKPTTPMQPSGQPPS